MFYKGIISVSWEKNILKEKNVTKVSNGSDIGFMGVESVSWRRILFSGGKKYKYQGHDRFRNRFRFHDTNFAPMKRIDSIGR